jgi:hypothetical protein
MQRRETSCETAELTMLFSKRVADAYQVVGVSTSIGATHLP